MHIWGWILTSIFITQTQIQGDIHSKAHIRFSEEDTARLSWFRTSLHYRLLPLANEKISTKIGFTIQTTGCPSFTNVKELSNPSIHEPIAILLNETFIRIYDILPGLTFTAGRQLVHWGTADAINPTDNFTTPDYSDPISWDERRPVWMVHIGYTPISTIGVEFAIKPLFEPAILPPQDWFSYQVLPTEEELRNGIVIYLINQGIDSLTARQIASLYTITKKEEIDLPKRELKNITWGGRGKFHISTFDFSLSFFRGYDFLPYYLPVTIIRPEDYRMDFILKESFLEKRVIGADFAGDIAGIGIWAEAGYNFYPDKIAKDEFSMIGGFDYTFAGFYINLQFLHGHFPFAFNANNRSKYFLLGGLERKLFSDQVLLRLGGIYDLKKSSFGLIPLLRLSPISGLELDLGGLIFEGSNGSAFAALDKIKEVTLGFRYHF